MKFKVKDPVTLDADIYSAKFVDYEEAEMMHGPAVKMSFEITDGLFAGEKIVGIAGIPDELTPKTKLRTWCEALMGRKLAGYTGEVDLDSLKGRPCRLNVIVVDKDGTSFNRVEGVLSPPKPTRPAAPESELPE